MLKNKDNIKNQYQDAIRGAAFLSLFAEEKIHCELEGATHGSDLTVPHGSQQRETENTEVRILAYRQ